MTDDALSHKSVEKYLLSLPGASLGYPFGEDAAVYKMKDKMFAIIQEDKVPINLSLKCDPNLSELLQKEYETVMPGYHLNKKHWITIVLSGQLPWDEVKNLIDLSYNLVKNSK